MRLVYSGLVDGRVLTFIMRSTDDHPGLGLCGAVFHGPSVHINLSDFRICIWGPTSRRLRGSRFGTSSRAPSDRKMSKCLPRLRAQAGKPEVT